MTVTKEQIGEATNEMRKACRCGFEPQKDKLADTSPWGYVQDPCPLYVCTHTDGSAIGGGLRYCRSCSQYWWGQGLRQDYDEGGPCRADCPECVAFDASGSTP